MGLDSYSYFNDALGAQHQSIDFSFDSFVDRVNRDTFGANYYDLPGHSNPVQQARGQYLGQVYSNMGVVSQRGGVTGVTIAGGSMSYATTDEFGLSKTGPLGSVPPVWITLDAWINNWQQYPQAYRNGVAYIIANRAGMSPDDVRIQQLASQITYGSRHIFTPCEAVDVELWVGGALVPAGGAGEKTLENIGKAWGTVSLLGLGCN